MHDYGPRVNSGEINDDEFLFVWGAARPTATTWTPTRVCCSLSGTLIRRLTCS